MAINKNKRLAAYAMSLVLLIQILCGINIYAAETESDKYEYEPGNFILDQNNTLSWKNPKSDKLQSVSVYMLSDDGEETDVTSTLTAVKSNGSNTAFNTSSAIVRLPNASDSDNKVCNVRTIFRFSDGTVRNLIIGETYGTTAVFIQQAHSSTPNPNNPGSYLNVDVYNGSAAAKASLSNTVVKSGNNSLKVESNKTDNSYFSVEFGGLNANTSYSVSMQVNTVETAKYDFDGVNITLPDTGGKWQTVAFDYTTGTSTSFKIKPVGASREVYFDDITFTKKGESIPWLTMGFETRGVSAPNNLDAANASVGDGEVKLKWETQKSYFLGYINVYQKATNGELLLRARLKRPGSSQVILSDLKNDIAHTFVIKVQSVNNAFAYGLETDGITVTATPHLYSDKLSIVQTLERYSAELENLVAQCKSKNLIPSYEIAEANVVGVFAKKVRRLYNDFDYDEIAMYEPKVTEVYNEVKQWLNDIINGKSEVITVPDYDISSNEIKDGSLVTKMRDGKEIQRAEIGFSGFYCDENDYEDMTSVGIRAIQGGKFGPDAFLIYDEDKQDFVINPEKAPASIAELRKELDLWREKGILVDMGIPIHYAADVSSKSGASDYRSAGGDYSTFINFNPTSDTAKKMIKKYYEIFIPIVYEYRDIVTSLTIVNEPYFEAYDKSYYFDKWTAYLTDKYGNISSLNSIYNTSYSSFDDVKMPEWIPGRDENSTEPHTTQLHMDYRLFVTDIMYEFFDYCVKEINHYTNGEIPCGVKTMEFFRERISRWKTCYSRAISYDYEKIMELLDFNGMDSFSFYMDSRGEREESITISAKLSWYDFTTSIKDVPIFDTETHLAVDDADSTTDGCQMEDTPILADYMAASAWMGAIHGCDLAAIWSWADMSQTTFLQNTIFTRRPDAMLKMSRTALDARRLSDEINAFQDAKRNVAILYSYECLMQNLQYQSNMFTVYNTLIQKGQKPLYVTDNSIDKITDCSLLVIPGNLLIKESTVDAILNYISNGGEVIVIGENSFSRDMYNKPLESGTLKNKVASLKSKATVISANLLHDTPKSDFEPSAADKIETVLNNIGLMNTRLVNKSTNKTAEVEWNAVEYKGETLISACNYSDNSITVTVEKDGKMRTNISDIKSNLNNLSDITLEPFVPVLLKVPSSEITISLLKATGAETFNIEKGKTFAVKLAAENIDSESVVTAKAIAALYCGDDLVSAKTTFDISLNKGNKKTAYISGISVPDDDREYTLKIMLWDGTRFCRPLRKPKIITE
ncbi:MAG: beta-galactosidase [Eubacteriales bacterium]|nr:beta-galactosidase [Eubacteriales bacterium]